VKGELSSDGKTITIPTGQNVAWIPSMNCFMEMQVLDYDEPSKTFVIDQSAQSISLSIQGKTITLDGTNEKRILGLVYSDSREWALFGDYSSVYTLFEEQAVDVPQNLVTENYLLKGKNPAQKDFSGKLKIGFQGNDVFIKGLCSNALPEAWVKGVRKENGNLCIPTSQFAGIYNDVYPVFFMAETITGNTVDIHDVVICL